MSKEPQLAPEIYTHPDAREGFERAVDKAVKSGPQHRAAPRPHEEMKLGKPKGQIGPKNKPPRRGRGK